MSFGENYSQISDIKVDKLDNITNRLSELSFGKQGWYLCSGFSPGSSAGMQSLENSHQLPGSESLSRTLKATTRTAPTNKRVPKTRMNHFMSSLAGRLDVKSPTNGMERDLGLNFQPYFFPSSTEMFSSTLWTQIANQIPAREPVCLQAHTPRPFGARIHGVEEIITFQMFGEKRLLLCSHVISDFGALEKGSHMLGRSHEGRQEDSCPQCKVTTEASPPPRPHRSNPCGHIPPPLSLHAPLSPSGYH